MVWMCWSARPSLLSRVLLESCAGMSQWCLQAPEVTADKLACCRVTERGRRPPSRSQGVKFLQTQTRRVVATVTNRVDISSIAVLKDTQ